MPIFSKPAFHPQQANKPLFPRKKAPSMSFHMDHDRFGAKDNSPSSPYRKRGGQDGQPPDQPTNKGGKGKRNKSSNSQRAENGSGDPEQQRSQKHGRSRSAAACGGQAVTDNSRKDDQDDDPNANNHDDSFSAGNTPNNTTNRFPYQPGFQPAPPGGMPMFPPGPAPPFNPQAVQQLHQQCLHLQTQMFIMQQQMHVQQQEHYRIAEKRNESREFDETNVYVSHLPIGVTHEEFFELMSRYGTVLSSRILVGDRWERRGVKGVGFARMSTEEEALTAIKGVNNLRLPGCTSVIRARLAFKTIRSPPPGESESYENTSSQDLDLSRSSPCAFHRHPQLPCAAFAPMPPPAVVQTAPPVTGFGVNMNGAQPAAPIPYYNNQPAHVQPVSYMAPNYGQASIPHQHYQLQQQGGFNYPQVQPAMNYYPMANYQQRFRPMQPPQMQYSMGYSQQPQQWNLGSNMDAPCATAAAAAAAAAAATTASLAQMSHFQHQMAPQQMQEQHQHPPDVNYWLNQGYSPDCFYPAGQSGLPPMYIPNMTWTSNFAQQQQAQPQRRRTNRIIITPAEASAEQVAPTGHSSATTAGNIDESQKDDSGAGGDSIATNPPTEQEDSEVSSHAANPKGDAPESGHEQAAGDQEGQGPPGEQPAEAVGEERLAGGGDDTSNYNYYGGYNNYYPYDYQPSAPPLAQEQYPQQSVSPPGSVAELQYPQTVHQQAYPYYHPQQSVPDQQGAVAVQPGVVQAQMGVMTGQAIPGQGVPMPTQGYAMPGQPMVMPGQQWMEYPQQPLYAIAAPPEEPTPVGLKYSIHFAHAFPPEAIPTSQEVPSAPAPSFASAMIASSQRKATLEARMNLRLYGRIEGPIGDTRNNHQQQQRDTPAAEEAHPEQGGGGGGGGEGDQQQATIHPEQGEQVEGATAAPSSPPQDDKPEWTVSMDIAQQCSGIILPDCYATPEASQNLEGIVWVSCGQYPSNPLMLYRDRLPIFGIYHPEYKLYWGCIFEGFVPPGLPLISCAVPRGVPLPAVPRGYLGADVGEAEVNQMAAPLLPA